jgi:putative membrane protein
MIPRFRDHAANERTYLAWVRTAIAIMAFGFLVERFDLFLAYLGRSGAANSSVNPAALSPAAAHHHLHAAQLVGLALIALGILIIIGATVRFVHHRRTIACEAEVGYGTAVGDGLLALLLICFAAFLGIYVYHQLMTLG